MLTDLYAIMFAACMEALLNPSPVVTLLPEHHQMYIIQGAQKACERELKNERMLMCIEQNVYCE